MDFFLVCVRAACTVRGLRWCRSNKDLGAIEVMERCQ